MRLDYTAGSLSENRHFYYTSDWQSLEERLGTGPASATAERQQVWGQRYIDDLVVRDRDTSGDGTLNERFYGLQDANWNMVALIDASATAQERYLYSPFGWPIFLNGTMSTILATSTVESETLFTGQRFELLTCLHLFRRRPYDSITGRFITRDPLLYPNGLNTYAGWFVPNASDPLGMEIVVAIMVGIKIGSIAKGLGHWCIAAWATRKCRACWDSAAKMAQMRLEALLQNNDIDTALLLFDEWKNKARPGDECDDICSIAGQQFMQGVVWLVVSVGVGKGARTIKVKL